MLGLFADSRRFNSIKYGYFSTVTVVETVGWLVDLRIYVALAIFQPYRDLEAGDNKPLKS